MWCEIRRHTLRHLYRGYWSALRVERLHRNRCEAGETPLHLVFGHAEASASVITAWFGVSVGWFPYTEVSRHVSPGSVMPRQKTAQRGFLIKHFKDAEKKGDVFTTLSGLANLLANDSEMKVDEALSWREIGASVSQVKLWKLHGFTPHEAVKWSNEGFQPKTASGWREAGVDSPVTARRRRDAGLQP